MDIRLSASVAIAVIFLSRTVLVNAEETQRNGFWGKIVDHNLKIGKE